MSKPWKVSNTGCPVVGTVILTVTLVVAPLTVAPAGLPFTRIVTVPDEVPLATLIRSTLVVPVDEGIRKLGVKDVHVTPVGSGVMHDSVTF